MERMVLNGKKIIRFAKTPSPKQKRQLQRQLAESNNVQEVMFDRNQMILHLYRRTPDENLLEELPLPEEQTVVMVD